MIHWRWLASCSLLLLAGPLSADDALRAQVRQTLANASKYYRTHVASHGGYVYYYSTDLKERWGEGAATVDTVFVQPPGTPTVGMAYLQAYAAIDQAYQAAKAGVQPASQVDLVALEKQVRTILRDFDGERWVSTYRGEHLVGQPKFARGFRYLSSAVFSRHVETLSAYYSATPK